MKITIQHNECHKKIYIVCNNELTETQATNLVCAWGMTMLKDFHYYTPVGILGTGGFVFTTNAGKFTVTSK